MGIRRGSISTPIIADGLVFNMDAANRASTIPSTSTLKTFNTIDTSISGSIVTDSTWEDGSPPTFDFDGSDGYINFGDNDFFSFGNSSNDSAFSFCGWINMDSTTRFRFISKYRGSNYEYHFDVGGSDKLQLYLFDGGNWRARYQNSILNTGQWYHVAATYNGVGGTNAQDGIRIYVDSIRVDDSTASSGTYTAMNNTAAPFNIGRLDSNYANGKISNIQIYNRALSASEVLHNYNALKSRFGL